MPERVALVIGNREYVKATVLQTSARDASAVAEVLRHLEFQCGDVVLDADWNAFQKAMRQFHQALDGASLAVFYYAGHSIQVQDVNYLLPVDADIRTRDSLPRHAFSLNEVLDAIKAKAKTSIILLDGCRDDPFGSGFLADEDDNMRAITPRQAGPASIPPSQGDVGIFFATSPGQAAKDYYSAPNGPSRHSPFTEALLANLEMEGLSFQTIAALVTQQVKDITGGAQRPWLVSSLSKDLILRQAPPPREPPPKVWNVPQRQNRYFTGRKDLLERLRDALSSGDPALSVQAVCGLGGSVRRKSRSSMLSSTLTNIALYGG